MDLRHLLPAAVPAQGPRPLCVPFALTAGHEARRSSAANLTDALAPEALWWTCTQRGQTSAMGLLLEHGAAALTAPGQPFLGDWPYNASLGSGSEPPPASADSVPWLSAEFCDVPVANDGIEDRIEVTLAAGVPVILILELTNEFEKPDEHGVVAVPDLSAPAGDYHAVLVVGAAHHVAGRHFLVRNSWGDWWGLGGYCWLPVAYLIDFCVQAGKVTVSGSVNEGPRDMGVDS